MGKILILGTFHMSEHEGLNAENRQREIEQLVHKLARFKPTKIAVEMDVAGHEKLNEKYNNYKQGTYRLEMNEIFQIGFRLGVKLKHEQIYPIDWIGKPELGYGEVEMWAKENQPELIKEIYEDLNIPDLTEEKSLLSYYRELNNPSFHNQLHKLYVNLARIGDFNNYIGLKWLTWWYERNLILFANLTRLIHSKDDRILFIVGVSHSTIVNNFIEESEAYEAVDPLKFLS